MRRVSPDEKKPTPLRAVGVALALGVALAWAAVFLIPTGEKLGLGDAAARRLPYAGFALGIAWGAVAHFSKNAKELLVAAVGVPVVGAVFWWFGVLFGALLVGFGVDEETADMAPLAAFWLGAALGAVSLLLAVRQRT